MKEIQIIEDETALNKPPQSLFVLMSAIPWGAVTNETGATLNPINGSAAFLLVYEDIETLKKEAGEEAAWIEIKEMKP